MFSGGRARGIGGGLEGNGLRAFVGFWMLGRISGLLNGRRRSL